MEQTNEKDPHLNSNTNSKTKRADRSQKIIRRMKSFGLFGKDTIGAAYNRATTCRDLEQAFRLVHDVYVEAGYIRPHPYGIRLRHYECDPTTATFTAKAASHETIGVMSVVMDSPDFGLPSDRIYKNEIDILRRKNAKICEFSNQAVLKEFRKKGPSTELMRCAFAYAYSMGVSDIIFSVSPNVVSFYEMMHFKRFGPTRNYSNTLNDPVVLIHVPNIQSRGEEAEISDDLSYRFFMRFFYQENPHIRRFHSWEILNERMFNDPFEMASLLSKCPELILDETYELGMEKRLGPIYTLTKAAVTRTPNTEHPLRIRTHATLPQRRPILSAAARQTNGPRRSFVPELAPRIENRSAPQARRSSVPPAPYTNNKINAS